MVLRSPTVTFGTYDRGTGDVVFVGSPVEGRGGPGILLGEGRGWRSYVWSSRVHTGHAPTESGGLPLHVGVLPVRYSCPYVTGVDGESTTGGGPCRDVLEVRVEGSDVRSGTRSGGPTVWETLTSLLSGKS